MIYFPTPQSCPNRKYLETVTPDEAAMWAAKASTHCTEVSRLAQIETFYSLPRKEVEYLHYVALNRI